MRYFGAWLGRFISVDPLQFEYPYLTPFQYASNRPISGIDLDGGEWKPVVGVKENDRLFWTVNTEANNEFSWSLNIG